jgi:hypothetical protein
MRLFTAQLAGATAIAAVLALAPTHVTLQGLESANALAEGGEGSGRDGGSAQGGREGNGGTAQGGGAGATDGSDPGKAGGNAASVGGNNPSGTEGNQGNSGTMGNAGGSRNGGPSQVGQTDRTHDTNVDDDDDDEVDDDDKPQDATLPGRDNRGAGMPGGLNDSQKAEAHNQAAALLGNLNAAHASPTARANASPNSMVGQIAAYEAQMIQAMTLQDATRRTAAITAAREQLALAANKPLTEDVIARVDGLLGIQGVSPQLGAVR